MPDAAQTTIAKFVRILNELEIEYYIGGSIASIVYGSARTTRDVDFVVTLNVQSAEMLVNRLEGKFYVDEVAVQRSIREGLSFNALDLTTFFQVDVFTPVTSEWGEQQFLRRELPSIGLQPGSEGAFLGSKEDTVLNKLNRFKLGNELSRLQWEDAVGNLRVQAGKLDHEYLTCWSRRLGLEALLMRAQIEAKQTEYPEQ